MNLYIFENNALEDFADWALLDKQVFKKILTLLKELKRTPYEGLGKPEPLRFDKTGYWSRRITLEHRLVYKINENQDILIASCKGHYD